MRVTHRAAGLLFLLAASAAAGGDLPWTQLGPYDGASGTPLGILSVLAVPHTATLYAGGYSGVFRSDDRGAHWANLGRPGGNEVTLLRADPSDAATVYAATNDGVFKTTDAGATWAPAGLPGIGVSALVLDPQSPNVLYAGTNSLAVDLSGRIYKSSDGGLSWSLLNVAPSGSVLSLAIDPRNSSTVFAGSLEGALLRSTDGGMTWLDSDQLPGAVLEIVIDPGRPGSVYARWNDISYIVWNVPAGALRHSIDGGATWSNVTGLPDRLPGPLLIDPNFPSVFYFEGYGDLYRSVDAGQTWAVMGPTPTYLEPAIAVGDPQYLYVAGDGVLRLDLSLLPPTCDATPTTLCLQYGRFSARVDWKQSPLGPSLQAEAVPVTTDSGYFWFFGPENVELMVKVLDGTAINGDFWVFYGALSNAAYTLTVTDNLTGAARVYENAQGTLASVADTSAFPGAVSAGASAAPRPPTALVVAAPHAVCIPDPAALCLEQGRFQVRVAWQRTPLGPSFSAAAVPLTGDTGYFWFFDGLNVELVVKVLDGTAVNGHYWVFYGALSDVQYTITVTDTQSGEERTYENPQGTLASVADTAAF